MMEDRNGVPWWVTTSHTRATPERVKAKAEQLATIYQRPEGADDEISRYVEGKVSPTWMPKLNGTSTDGPA